MFCTHCGTNLNLPEDAKFCPECGSTLPQNEREPDQTSVPEGRSGTELTPEDHQRIYEEEKARIDARERIEEERRDAELRLVEERRQAAEQEREYITRRDRDRKRKTRLRVAGLFVVFGIGVLFMGLFDREVRVNLELVPPSGSVSAGTERIESQVLDAIADSDDIDTQRAAFVTASTSLVEEGTCSLEDLNYNGGWVRTHGFDGRDVYYTFCGPGASTPSGATRENRIYLDVATGEVFR